MYYSRAELVDMGFKTLGENVFIDKRTPIDFPHKISLGNNIKIGSFCILSGDIVLKDNVRIASYVFLSGSSVGIEVGNYVCIASGTKVLTGSDDYSGEFHSCPWLDDSLTRPEYKKICIHDHAIIGTNSVLLPGAEIAEGVAVGALSLIKTKTQPYKIYAGVPAAVIKDRKRDFVEKLKANIYIYNSYEFCNADLFCKYGKKMLFARFAVLLDTGMAIVPLKRIVMP